MKNVLKFFFLISCISLSLFLGSLDEHDLCTLKMVYEDKDNDGFGDINSTYQICNNETIPEGYVDNADDADDNFDDDNTNGINNEDGPMHVSRL